MASYCYYILDRPVLSDGEFDELAKKLLAGWNNFIHPHKKWVTKADLKAGTLYKLRAEDYPWIVRGAADMAVVEKYGGCRCPMLTRVDSLPKGRIGYKCLLCNVTYSWGKDV